MTRAAWLLFRWSRVVVALSLAAMARAATEFTWDELPPLPPAHGQTVQPGVAGAFAGVHGGALIVAGGANFPEKLPWEGGTKVWWDDVWVLENFAGPNPRWSSAPNLKLDRPLAYGVSVTTRDGVVCIGGSDATQCYAEVVVLTWDAATRSLRKRKLPSLPTPLAFMCAAYAGSTVYVAGGQRTMKGATALPVFWALSLGAATDGAAPQWRELPTWPGPPRILAVTTARHERDGEAVYVFGGRAPQPGGATKIWTDGYRFATATQTWQRIPPLLNDRGVSVMAATAAAGPNADLLIFGGDRGDVFLALEQHDLAVAQRRLALATASTAVRARLESEIDEQTAAKLALYHTHPGLSRDVLAYDTTQRTWRVAGTAPFPLPVTTTAVPVEGGVIFASGEIKPGIRTPRILRLRWTTR